MNQPLAYRIPLKFSHEVFKLVVVGIVEVLLVVIGNVMHHAFVDQIIHGLGGLEG